MHSHLVDEYKAGERGLLERAPSRPPVRVASGLATRPDEEVHIIYLADGRRLAYAEYGERTGFPLFYFHRHGSSRLEAGFMHKSARNAGFRLIAVDRPGMGSSDFNRVGSLDSFARDLVELADKLGLAHFGLVCNGGGSAFALAMAHAFPQRVSVLLGVSALPQLATSHCRAGRLLMGAVHFYSALRHAICARRPQRYISRLLDSLGYADRRLLKHEDVQVLLARDLREASRQGIRGVARDTALHYRDWGFDAATVEVPVHLWLGGADNLIPRHRVETFVSRCANAELHILPARGHFLFIRAMDDVFATANKLLGRAGKPLSPATPTILPKAIASL